MVKFLYIIEWKMADGVFNKPGVDIKRIHWPLSENREGLFLQSVLIIIIIIIIMNYVVNLVCYCYLIKSLPNRTCL
jgi:hypothetical protein